MEWYPAKVDLQTNSRNYPSPPSYYTVIPIPTLMRPECVNKSDILDDGGREHEEVQIQWPVGI